MGRRDFLKDTSVLLPLALGTAAALGGDAAGAAKADGSTTVPAAEAVAERRRARRRVDPRDVADELVEYMQGLTIIDSHEHLFPEKDRVSRPIDVLSLLHNYEYHDAVSAGMPLGTPGDNLFVNAHQPFEARFAKAWPFIRAIRHGGYFTANAIALRDLYGIGELNPDSAPEAARRVREANRKGLYEDVLKRRCKIATCLVQNDFEEQDPKDLMTPVVVGMRYYQGLTREIVQEHGRKAGATIASLDDYLKVVDLRLERERQNGAVGLKIWARPMTDVTESAARTEFATLLKEDRQAPGAENFVLQHLIERAAALDWPVAMHTGVWGDFRQNDPKFAIEFLARFRNVRFDIYHLGIPFSEQCVFIAKSFPNAHLNLCWTYLVSETITRHCVNMILDAVPVTKVFGFGGDMVLGVESVYGHLVMARESLGAALGHRVADGRINVDSAKEVLKLWLFDNAKGFYRLKV